MQEEKLQTGLGLLRITTRLARERLCDKTWLRGSLNPTKVYIFVDNKKQGETQVISSTDWHQILLQNLTPGWHLVRLICEANINRNEKKRFMLYDQYALIEKGRITEIRFKEAFGLFGGGIEYLTGTVSGW